MADSTVNPNELQVDNPDTSSIALEKVEMSSGFDCPLVFVKLFTGKADMDNSGTAMFLWASPISAQPVDEEGNSLPRNQLGNLMIYGAPENLLEGGINSDGAGQFIEAYLKPRTIGGLYDFVARTEAEKMANALGMKLDDVPEPPFVLSASAERGNADRTGKRNRATAGRRLDTALSGATEGARGRALLSLQTGAGSADSSDPAVKAALELVMKAQAKAQG